MSFYCIKLGIGHRRPCTRIKARNRGLQAASGVLPQVLACPSTVSVKSFRRRARATYRASLTSDLPCLWEAHLPRSAMATPLWAMAEKRVTVTHLCR